MKNTFLTISNRIIDKVPQIKIVDLNRGQFLQNNFPLEYPAVYISISYPSTDDVDDDSQIYSLTVGVKVIFDPSNLDTSSLTPIKWRKTSLDLLDIVDSLIEKLSGFNSEQFNDLKLRSAIPEPGAEFIYNLTFDSSFKVEY